MMYSSDIPTGFRLAFRARFGWLAGGALFVLALSAWLAAQFSGRQPATVALDVGLSVMRMILPLILVLMTQELISREFERRYYLNSLTYPVARHALLLGRFFAILVLSLGLLLVMGGLLAALVNFIGQDYAQGTPVALGLPYLTVLGFIFLDLLVLSTLAAFLAIVASTPSFVLIGTFGFMLVARSFSAIIELLTRNAFVVGDAQSYRSGIGTLGYLVPDLGALDLRMIALYGKMEFLPSDWPWLLLCSLSYAGGLLALAVWALNRKRFV